MNFKRKVRERMRKFSRAGSGNEMLYNLQDSLKLLRRRKNANNLMKKRKTEKLLPADSGEDSDSKEVKIVDKLTICRIEDDGLDSSSDGDSSIEYTREAPTSFLPTGNIIPEIFIEKVCSNEGLPSCSHWDDILNNTENMNIKNSTMNHPPDALGLDELDEMPDLSPITKAQKNKDFLKLVSDLGQASVMECENSTKRDFDETEAVSTGNTPPHIKRALKKFRANEKKAKRGQRTERTEISCFNYDNDSLHFVTKSKEPSLPMSKFDVTLSDESSEDWSPTKRKNEKKKNQNWLDVAHGDNLEFDKRTYLHPTYRKCDITPAWKKSIAKPAKKPRKKSFRTSSPSRYTMANAPSPKTKRSLLQLSSIRDCTSDVSVELRPRTSMRQTINSDEIAPLSPSNLDESQMSEIVFNEEVLKKAVSPLQPVGDQKIESLGKQGDERMDEDVVVRKQEMEILGKQEEEGMDEDVKEENGNPLEDLQECKMQQIESLDQTDQTDENANLIPKKSNNVESTDDHKDSPPDRDSNDKDSTNFKLQSPADYDSDIIGKFPSPVHYCRLTNEVVSLSQLAPDDTIWDHV